MKPIIEQIIESAIEKFDIELKKRLKEALIINGISFESDKEFIEISKKRVRNIQYSSTPYDYNFYLDDKIYLFSCNGEELTFYMLKP